MHIGEHLNIANSPVEKNDCLKAKTVIFESKSCTCNMQRKCAAVWIHMSVRTADYKKSMRLLEKIEKQTTN